LRLVEVKAAISQNPNYLFSLLAGQSHFSCLTEARVVFMGLNDLAKCCSCGSLGVILCAITLIKLSDGFYEMRLRLGDFGKPGALFFKGGLVQNGNRYACYGQTGKGQDEDEKKYSMADGPIHIGPQKSFLVRTDKKKGRRSAEKTWVMPDRMTKPMEAGLFLYDG
jgi:hypothetical protein